MNSAVVLALIALLTAHVDDVAASCRKVPNDDMLEYLCEGGHPGDLATVPETTEKLRISRMPLRRITDDTFAKFGDKLWVLSCSHCEISEIEVNAFRRLVNLQQLSLDNNYLTVVKASWFEGLDSLTYLDINYNDIREIENGVYQNLPALVDFRISGNRLRCLNLDEMSYLRQLKRMFLGENPEFACPHAVSEFLENQHVTFERDPEWKKLVHDAVEVHVPPVHAEEKHEEHEIDVPPHRGQLYPDSRPPQQPGAPVAPPLTEDRPFHSAEHYGRRRRPMTTTTSTTTMRPIMSQSHVPRVEPIPAPGNMRDSHKELPVQTPGSSRPMLFYPYPTPETPRAPLQESKPPLENARMTAEADRPPLTEDVSYPSYVPTRHGTSPSYPIYVTSEKSQAPSEESRPFPENIRFMPGTNWSLPTEYDLYPAYKPTHEITSSYPSYTTSEGSRDPLIESRIPSEDTTASTARPDRPMLTEHTVTYPPHEPTRETMSYPYPYVTSEGSRGPLIESRTPSEDITASTARPDRPMLTEHAVTYPPHEPTRETMSYPYPYVTSEGSRGSLIESRIPSEDTTASTARPDRPMLTEHTVTYPPHEPTRETMSYPYPYVTSEKSPISIVGTEASSENEMTTWTTGVSSSHSPQEIVYPLYVATPDGREKMPHGSIQISRPWSTSDPDAFVTSRTSWTDDSMQHRPDDWSQDGARHEQRLSSSLTTNAPTGRQETPYHVSREPTGRGYMIDVEEWSSSTDATDLPVERDNEDADKEKWHYVQPLSHPVATDESHDDDKAAIGMETTTDKPLPDCPKRNSAPRARPASVLVMSIVVVIFGHVIVAGF